jgi:hypothetical protein
MKINALLFLSVVFLFSCDKQVCYDCECLKNGNKIAEGPKECGSSDQDVQQKVDAQASAFACDTSGGTLRCNSDYK